MLVANVDVLLVLTDLTPVLMKNERLNLALVLEMICYSVDCGCESAITIERVNLREGRCESCL